MRCIGNASQRQQQQQQQPIRSNHGTNSIALNIKTLVLFSNLNRRRSFDSDFDAIAFVFSFILSWPRCVGFSLPTLCACSISSFVRCPGTTAFESNNYIVIRVCLSSKQTNCFLNWYLTTMTNNNGNRMYCICSAIERHSRLECKVTIWQLGGSEMPNAWNARTANNLHKSNQVRFQHFPWTEHGFAPVTRDSRILENK